MYYPQKSPKNSRKKQELLTAMQELEKLLRQPFLQLSGGTVIKDQLSGGTFKKVAGAGYWHEKDVARMMALRHRYQRGEWSTEVDRREEGSNAAEKIPLKRSLSADHLRDMADFVEHFSGDPELVAALRLQAINALTSGDATEIYGAGLSARYDLLAENRVHKQGFAYFYFDDDGSLCGTQPPVVSART